MGLLSDIAGGVLGKRAADKATEAQVQGSQQGIGELRRQFDLTREDISPFIEAGTSALPEVQRGADIGGFGERLQEILGGSAFQSLIGERTRAAEGQLSAGGLTRSGSGVQGIADISSNLALQIEQLLSGRQAGIAGQGLGAATGLGQFGGQTAQGIAGLQGDIGRTRASGILTKGQIQAQLLNRPNEIAATILPQIFGGSDPDLKENIEEIGYINDLKLYQWDWIEAAKGTFLETCPTIGFMADEVKEKYPEFVKKIGSYDMIAYFALLDHLEAENNLILEAA